MNKAGSTENPQKVQIIRGPDGKVQVRGLMPGQQIVQMPDGKLHVLSSNQQIRSKFFFIRLSLKNLFLNIQYRTKVIEIYIYFIQVFNIYIRKIHKKTVYATASHFCELISPVNLRIQDYNNL